jgi:tRNA G10  N-methylase Trm11
MIRGTLANLQFLGISPERLKVGDAGDPFAPREGGLWDAVLTDPPYGRASGTGGEPAGALLHRALSAWSAFVRPGGWLSLVAPTTASVDLGPGWSQVATVPDRVHRSLTREFRTYRRAGAED